MNKKNNLQIKTTTIDQRFSVSIVRSDHHSDKNECLSLDKLLLAGYKEGERDEQ
jgi:hypothetical protein